MASVGAGFVSVRGSVWVAVYAVPLLLAMCALRLRVELPAAADPLPVRVSVQTAAPDALTVGLLHFAVTPPGRPEATLMVEPEAPVGIAAPPAGVAVTVTVVEAFDTMETEAGDADN